MVKITDILKEKIKAAPKHIVIYVRGKQTASKCFLSEKDAQENFSEVSRTIINDTKSIDRSLWFNQQTGVVLIHKKLYLLAATDIALLNEIKDEQDFTKTWVEILFNRSSENKRVETLLTEQWDEETNDFIIEKISGSTHHGFYSLSPSVIMLDDFYESDIFLEGRSTDPYYVHLWERTDQCRRHLFTGFSTLEEAELKMSEIVETYKLKSWAEFGGGENRASADDGEGTYRHVTLADLTDKDRFVIKSAMDNINFH